MNLLPSIASIADLFTRPLPTISHHRYTQLVIGDDPITPSTTSVDTATVDTSATVAPTPTVDPLATVVASGPIASASVPVALDTGASLARTPFASDFPLEITQAPYGLFRSAASVTYSSSSKGSSKATLSNDPYTLITGEDVSVSVDSDPVDLSSPDTTTISDLSSFTKVSFDIRQFGTASLTFIFSPNLDLIKVFVTPTQVDWIHWVPLPRLILPESYFHIFGLDYLQAFTLLHLIPIWIYCLLHFAVNLED